MILLQKPYFLVRVQGSVSYLVGPTPWSLGRSPTSLTRNDPSGGIGEELVRVVQQTDDEGEKQLENQWRYLLGKKFLYESFSRVDWDETHRFHSPDPETLVYLQFDSGKIVSPVDLRDSQPNPNALRIHIFRLILGRISSRLGNPISS